MILLGLILFVCSALFSYLLNEILYKYARKLGGESTGENVVRWASTTKPTVGGISFFITFILAALVYFITVGVASTGVNDFLGLVIVVTLGFFIGLQDDAYNTRPLLKFLGQVTCAVIMIIYNVHIDLFHIPILDYFLTVFWVVGIMNSINLLDNMDAVTASISLTIVAATILRMVLFPGGPAMNAFMFALLASAGAFVGFLIINWHPARIYMGDTGSQFLGALLAFLGVKFFWNFQYSDGTTAEFTARVIVPIMVFLVPIMDTTFVTIGRLMRGQSPFVGGKDHLTHGMSYLGVPDSRVPVVLSIVSVASNAVAIFGMRYLFPQESISNGYLHTLTFAGYVVINVGIFFYLYKRGERIGQAKQRFSRTFHRVNQERQKQSASLSEAKEKQHS